jgi:exopolysaccharide biosynthesis polyprenyl glycosylphosphotransferase
MTCLKLLDLAIVALSFALSTLLLVSQQHRLSLAQFLSMRTKVSDFGLFALTLLVGHIALRSSGLYRSMRLSLRSTEFASIFRGTSLCVAGWVVISLAFSVQMMTIPFLAAFWAVSSVLLCVSRQILRPILGYIRSRGRNLRYMLIVGTNQRAVEFARKVLEDPDRGYRILGFVDDEWPGLAEFRGSGFELVSNFDGLAEFLRVNVVDEIAIYLSIGRFFDYYSEVARLCEQHGVIMRFDADIFKLGSSRFRAEVFDDTHYLATYTGSGSSWPQTVKRLIDVVVASCSLVLLLPVLLIAAIAIKLSSPGPVFFMQERIGLNKRRFKIFKFRTMVPNAEKLMRELEAKNELEGPAFKMKNDPRITPIGRYLRKSSIDELPQLLNVLKGDMSLVGPRPLPVRDFEGFNEDWQRRRFSVRPGITCLWQVNGRSSLSFNEWMLLDLQYMDEWSLWLDLKILARTVPAVLKGAGAV